VSPVKYVPLFYIPEDNILHSHRRENINLTRTEYNDVLTIPLYVRQPIIFRISGTATGPVNKTNIQSARLQRKIGHER
jgi:hypothetical protein